MMKDVRENRKRCTETGTPFSILFQKNYNRVKRGSITVCDRYDFYITEKDSFVRMTKK